MSKKINKQKSQLNATMVEPVATAEQLDKIALDFGTNLRNRERVLREHIAMRRVNEREMQLAEEASIKAGARHALVEAMLKCLNKVLPYFLLGHIIGSMSKGGL